MAENEEAASSNEEHPREPRNDLPCEQCRRIGPTELYRVGVYDQKKLTRLCDTCRPLPSGA